MPAEAQAPGAVGVLEFGEDVIPDVAVILFPTFLAAVVQLPADVLGRIDLAFIVGSPASPTHGGELNRRAVEAPVHNIDVVNVLLANLVARNPIKVVPVIALPFQFAHAFLITPEPDAAAVPVALTAYQLANLPVVDAFHQLDAAKFMPALRAADNGQAFVLSQLRGRHHFPAAGDVGGDGLLREDMFSGLDGRHHLPSAKGRGRRHQQQVRFALSDLLVTIKTPEKMVVIDLHAILILIVSHESFPGSAHLALEQVGQGDHFDSGIRVEVLAQGAVAASAATEQTDLDLAGPSRMGHMRHRTGQRRGAGGRDCMLIVRLGTPCRGCACVFF